jgi:hypothetical protein
MAYLFNLRFLVVADHQFGICAIEFQCYRLCYSLFFRTDTEYRWKLFPLNSFGSFERHDEKTQNNSFDCLHTINNIDYSDSCGYSDTWVGLFIFNNTGLSLLLVHYQFYTFWTKNIEKIM